MSNSDLSTPQNQLPSISVKDEWVTLQRQCMAFIDSGFLPDHIWKGVEPKIALARALTIAWKGKELGIPPLQAFASITVIKGKPCLSAELMLALIYQRVRGAKVTFRTPPEKQAEECVVEFQRPGGEPQQFRFTMKDAQGAGLLSSSSAWQKYPQAMLRARAVSAGARAVFPDCIMGAYTPEELGAETIDVEPAEIENAPLVESKPTPNPQPSDDMPAPVKTPGPQFVEGDSGGFPFEGAAELQVSSGGVRRTDARGFPHGDYPKAKPGWEKDLATEAQRKRLWAMAKEANYDEGQLKDLVMNLSGKDSTKDLTKSDIQAVFKTLEAEINSAGRGV